MQPNYKSYTIKLIVFVAIAKLLFSNYIELGNDEAYYYTYALLPDINYFDHPPFVAWFICIGTLNLTQISDISMRLAPIIASALSSYYIFKTTTLLRNEKAGWYATLIFNVCIYTNFIAGWFIVPDAAQLPFWCLSLFTMANILMHQKQYSTPHWLQLGLFIGLACLGKVHGLYLWAGFGLFILIYHTNWLLNVRLYFGFLVTVITISPILIWNINNNFITYNFHSNRVNDTSFKLDSLVREILGEWAYQNPLVIATILVALIYFVKQKAFKHHTILVWLLCMSLPMIFLFWGVSAFNPTLPHWAGPGYIALIILAGLYFEIKAQIIYPKLIKAAGILVITVLLLLLAAINFSPINFGNQTKENYGEYCPTLDVSGWQQFAKDFNALQQQQILQGAIKPNSPILISMWFPAAQLEYYVSRETKNPVIATGNLEDVHQFAWLNKTRNLQAGDDGYCIVPSNYPINVQEKYGKYFTSISQPTIINQVRSGKVVRYFTVYVLKNCIDASIKTELP